jgi:hypothetical protein
MHVPLSVNSFKTFTRNAASDDSIRRWQFRVVIALIASILIPFLTAWRGVRDGRQRSAAVATWGIAILHDKFVMTKRSSQFFCETLAIMPAPLSSADAEKVRTLRAASPLPGWSAASRHDRQLDAEFKSYEQAAGLPFRWLVISAYARLSQGDINIERNSALHDATGIYGRVLVGRLVANIVIVFAITLLLLQSPFIFIAIRRRIRVKRGQCPECAYPATGAACPECGSASTASTTPTSA